MTSTFNANSKSKCYPQYSTNLIYKRKIKKLRGVIQDFVFENAALCDQVSQIQENILCMKEERRFLLKKLIEYDKDFVVNNSSMNQRQSPMLPTTSTHANDCVGDNTQNATNSIQTFKKSKKKTTKTSEINATTTTKNNALTTITTSTTSSTNNNTITTTNTNFINNTTGKTTTTNFDNDFKYIKCEEVDIVDIDKSTIVQQEQQQQQQQQHNLQREPFVQTITVDQMGCPIYPITIGNLLLYDLGNIICDRIGFHNENWVYPVGFVSTRVYGDYREPERKCTYTCKIVDNGDSPQFELIPDSDTDYSILGPTPDLCHAALLQLINNKSDIHNIMVRPQGEWFFGLAHPTVMTLLQSSSDIKKLQNFKSFKIDTDSMDKDIDDPTLNYEALQRYIAMSVYHTVPEIKEEPPDDLLEPFDSSSSFNLT